MKYLIKASEVLKTEGYKITKSRLAVLRSLSQANVPLSPYELKDRMRFLNISPVTIYRILDLLEQLSLVHKSLLDGGYVRCEKIAEEGCHHLAVCRTCKSFSEFTEIHNHQAEQERFAALPFEELCHLYELQGICKSCA